MRNNNATSFIIVMGILVFVVFTGTLVVNLLPNHESNSYYVKVEDEMQAKIENLGIQNDQLVIKTSGDAFKVCVKSTRSTPNSGNLCWKQISRNEATVSVYKDTEYYVWIMDSKGNINRPTKISNS